MRVKIILCLIAAGYVFKKSNDAQMAIYAFIAALVLCFLLPPVMKLFWKRMRKKRYLRSPISKIDSMEGHEFEEYLQALYEKNEYKCKIVGEKGHDYGVDLIIKKNGVKTAVQAKRYQNIVGIKAVQEVASGKSYYDCDDAIVVTNSHFSKAAKELAEKCGVGLIDREYLKKLYE